MGMEMGSNILSDILLDLLSNQCCFKNSINSFGSLSISMDEKSSKVNPYLMRICPHHTHPKSEKSINFQTEKQSLCYSSQTQLMTSQNVSQHPTFQDCRAA